MNKRILSMALALVLALVLAAWGIPAYAAGCRCMIEYRLGSKGVCGDFSTNAVA